MGQLLEIYGRRKCKRRWYMHGNEKRRDRTIAGTLPAGSYETLPTTLPLTDNYVSKFQTDKLGALTFTPAETSGSATTGACDYYYHSALNSRIVLSGGFWNSSLPAGVGARNANNTPLLSSRDTGARLVFRGDK